MNFTHDTFISPFTWRYGSEAMRQIWSEQNKRRLMRQVWLALATAQHQAGLVSASGWPTYRLMPSRWTSPALWKSKKRRATM
ncbi:MAG: hypothetical protein R3D55_02535 [Chloroflexota bacterium]